MVHTETVVRVDRVVCCEKGKVYSQTIALLRNGERVEFVDSEHRDWVNLRAGDTVTIDREYHFMSARIVDVKYTINV